MSRFSAVVLFLSFGIVVQLTHGIEVNVMQNGELCLYANLMLNFSVSYQVDETQFQTVTFSLPEDAISEESKCEETSSTLKLKFGDGHFWSVNFTLNENSYQADVITFSYNLNDLNTFPNSASNEILTVTQKPQMSEIDLNTCYFCKSQDVVQAGETTMTLWDVLIQAFITKGTPSQDMTLCAADSPTTTTTTTTATTTTTTTTATTTTTLATTTNATTTTTTTAPPATNTTTTAPPATNTTTTAPPVTNTTTTAPPVTNTTTTAPPTTTSPTPTLPPPSTGKYNLTTPNNTVCLLASFALRISYTQDGKKGELNLDPSVTKASGLCGESSSELELVSDQMTLTMAFTNDTKKFRLNSLNVTLKTSSGVFADGNANLSLWEAAIGSSYMCNREQNFNITSLLSLHTSNLQVQPFGVKKDSFSTAEECQGDAESFLVPIAVGVALLILIVVVVVAYFIGRRRNMATGYESF
ncbi:lysosome-associated membrane glycoprotein 2 isoform X1 [Oryzias melastigma]|uniref:lysosome-associated membrane glycoprotein 2 isoform X1 n=2 Tax=Oryzias melastigma TaxID=30732 RepID=UPI000CF7B553|nr:lysosome-associated membrane glycoprotein 2 isoform X1 [Oryzias melastigma]